MNKTNPPQSKSLDSNFEMTKDVNYKLSIKM